MGPAPVGVHCLPCNEFPSSAILGQTVLLLYFSLTPADNVVHPLSTWPASFIRSVYNSDHQCLLTSCCPQSCICTTEWPYFAPVGAVIHFYVVLSVLSQYTNVKCLTSITPKFPKFKKMFCFVPFHQNWQNWPVYKTVFGNSISKSNPLMALYITQPEYATTKKNHLLKQSQAAQECKPCVNGHTSFQWEVLWLSAFFANIPGGQTPQPIVMQNGLNDTYSGKVVPFGVKFETFCTTWLPAPENHKVVT